MDILQKSLEKSLAEVPQMFLAKLIERKLREQEIKVSKSLPRKIAEHILSGDAEPFRFGKSSDHRNVTLAVSEADIQELEKDIANFLETGLPRLVPDMASRVAKPVLESLKTRWPEEHTLQTAELSAFRERLEERWGEPLNGLRMLLTMARDWGREAHNRNSMRRAKNKVQREILLRLHVRGCQVADEILCLLENGFSDGAMARWRTLHELTVVAAVISLHGEEIAKRFLAHQAIESRRAMTKYISSSALLGYRALTARVVNKIEKDYQSAIARYGKEFDADFGWATRHLNRKRVTFADLEAEAGRAEMRSHYQMANDNVHAGIKSLYVRLGLLDSNMGLLAGRSNVGLMEPGQNAAHTLTELSAIVCLADATFDNIVTAELMRQVGAQIPRAFYRADRQLLRDERKLKAPARKRPLSPKGGRDDISRKDKSRRVLERYSQV